MADVLIIGSGGREDALKQAMEASPETGRVEVFGDIEKGREAFKGSNDVFSIIGPEKALANGAADYLREAGHIVLGVSGDAAKKYEGSKSKAIKTVSELFPYTYTAEGKNMAYDARRYVETQDPETYFIKADAFASGKGSVGSETRQRAREVVEEMIAGGYEGAGKEIINFQEFCEGPEMSPIAVVGRNGEFVRLPNAQDHKKLHDGDKGPNTGGTGAYTPVPESVISEAEDEEIDEMITIALERAAASGVPIEQGILYAGVIKALNLEKVKLGELETSFRFMEFNVRFGDPETQPQLASMLASGVDVYRLLRSAAEGDLERPDIDLQKLPVSALSVAIMANGYSTQPEPETGKEIFGIIDQQYDHVTIQKAGMKVQDGRWVTSGGRVLYVTAIGETIDVAAARAYAAIGSDAIHFANMLYRKDIGWQARTAA